MSNPQYTPEEIVQRMRDQLESGIAEKQRAQVEITGEIAAMQTVLANLRYMIDAKKD